MKVKDKVIIVTGAGSGIGRELTLELARCGAKVAACDINKESLLETQKLAGEHQNKVAIFELDITNKEGVDHLPQGDFSQLTSYDDDYSQVAEEHYS